MEKQNSRWFNIGSVPESYRFPPDHRPGKITIPMSDTVPVISLAKSTTPERPDIVQEIFDAGREFGIFQVVDHGVLQNLAMETLDVFKNFFNLSVSEKSSSMANENCWIYTESTDFAKDGIHLWRENIKHPCHPLEECMLRLPENPIRYREVVGKYLMAMRELSWRILELISEGLELESRYFHERSEVQLLSVNHYPPCPDPSLTLGLLRHRDPSLITILFQGSINGLQVLKQGGQWTGVRALSDAFVVILGSQLEIISNGKLRSAEHRAVTNVDEARISITTFINPPPNIAVEPARALVDASNPPLYKPCLYKDFVRNSEAFGPDTEAIINSAISSWK